MTVVKPYLSEPFLLFPLSLKVVNNLPIASNSLKNVEFSRSIGNHSQTCLRPEPHGIRCRTAAFEVLGLIHTHNTKNKPLSFPSFLLNTFFYHEM